MIILDQIHLKMRWLLRLQEKNVDANGTICSVCPWVVFIIYRPVDCKDRARAEKRRGGGGGETHRSQVKDRTTAKIIYQSQIKDRTVQKNKTNEQKRFINYRSKIVPRKKFINHRSKIVTGEKCSSASGKSLLAIQFMVELLLSSEEN